VIRFVLAHQYVVFDFTAQIDAFHKRHKRRDYEHALRFCPEASATILEAALATTGATFTVPAAVAGVERLAAAAVVVAVVDGKATPAFSDKSIYKRLGLVRTA
jgi:hypothetical protein